MSNLHSTKICKIIIEYAQKFESKILAHHWCFICGTKRKRYKYKFNNGKWLPHTKHTKHQEKVNARQIFIWQAILICWIASENRYFQMTDLKQVNKKSTICIVTMSYIHRCLFTVEVWEQICPFCPCTCREQGYMKNGSAPGTRWGSVTLPLQSGVRVGVFVEKAFKRLQVTHSGSKSGQRLPDWDQRWSETHHPDCNTHTMWSIHRSGIFYLP